MKTGGLSLRFVMIMLSGFLLTSCLLPGMIPLNPESTEPAEPVEPAASDVPEGSMPTMEKDPDVVLESLQAREGVYLATLAREEYSDEESDQPGTLTYTIEITDDRPTYFNYGWCTTTEEILLQNFEHIKIGFYFNGRTLGREVVHAIPSQVNDMICLNFVTLMSNWPNGEYQLTAVVTFEEKINDGVADFEAGDYIYEYNVTVSK
jgi:hypothetical protein